MCEPIIFNIIDVFTEDFQDDDDSSYIIKLFGRCANGKTVGATVTGFPPHFYIKPPFELRNDQLSMLQSYMTHEFGDGFISAKPMKKKDYWGFNNGKETTFIQIVFKSYRAMKCARYKFEKPIEIHGVSSKKVTFKLYESNIEPFLRFFHKRNVTPCGWIKIEKYSKSNRSMPYVSNCDIDIVTQWQNIEPMQIPGLAPFKIASFDIECVSYDGQFPLPKRDYKKLVQSFYDELYDHNAITFVEYFSNMATDGKIVHKKKLASDIITILQIHASDISNLIKGIIGFDEVSNKIQPLTKPLNPEKDKDIIIENLSKKLERILPDLEGDPIIMIGTTINLYGQNISEKHIFVLGSCDPIDDATVYTFETEKEMILAWTHFIRKSNPDIMLGYNIFGFDMEYMFVRSEELQCTEKFCELGKLMNMSSPVLQKKMLSSSALGDNLLKYIDIYGRVLIDIMKVVQRDHKLDSYKLDNVAYHFLKQNKNDVSPQEIFALYRGNSSDRKRVAEYCIQDCALLNKLCDKLEIVANNIGMANVCCVPITWIFVRGQGVKIFSLVAKQCKEDNYIIPVVKPFKTFGTHLPEDEEGYEGAIVLDPKPGIYMEPIAVLDYASLYPSSMISENISHDTIVTDPLFDNLPGVEYVNVVYDQYEGIGDKKVKTGEKTCRYAQNIKGVLPRILEHLLAQRKKTRKKMDWMTYTLLNGDVVTGLPVNENDNIHVTLEDGTKHCFKRSEIVSEIKTFNVFECAVLDGLQLAYKITANSLYGQVGARTSPIYLKELAASTTATGRNMILKAKSFIEQNCNGKIIYGDSIASYTPVIYKFKDQVGIDIVENIPKKFGGDKWLVCNDEGREEKEACELPGLQVWTDEGWTDACRLIRHKLAPHKKMLRVLTHTGVVDVTDDHSLIRKNGEVVKPKDLKIGDGLLHADLPIFAYTLNDITVEQARIMGIFMGDGSCGSYNPSEKKSSWAINNSNIEMLQMYKELCEKAYPDYTWVIMPTLESSGVYKLSPMSNCYGCVNDLVELYRKMMYDNKSKIVPIDILNSSLEVRRAFWQGFFYDADGDNDEHGYNRFDQKNQLSAATLYLLAKSLGYAVSLDIRNDKLHIYRLTITDAKQRNDSDEVNKIIEILYEGYVYDFTTSNHKFSCGVGRIIAHNTDSLFISAPLDKMPGSDATLEERVFAAMQFGRAASDAFKPHLKKPHDLEYEKVFMPFIILSKKRYVGNKYENDPTKFKMNCMGIVLKRRDNAHIVKTVYGGCIDILLNGGSIDHAVDFLTNSLYKLINGEYDMQELVITKSLRANYKDPEKIAHKVLAMRMAERDPGNKPQINDRIPFVYVEHPPPEKGQKLLQGDRIETPDFIKSNNLTPDYKFYITNQIMKPVAQLFALVVERLPGYNRSPSYWDDVKTELSKSMTHDKIKDKIESLRENEVEKLLFESILVKLGEKPKRRKVVLQNDEEPKPKRVTRKKVTPDPEPSDTPSAGSSNVPVEEPKPKRVTRKKVTPDPEPSDTPSAGPSNVP